MANQDWLLTKWTTLFGEAISAMAGQPVSITATEIAPTGEVFVWWNQKFNLGSKESIWIGSTQENWNSVSKFSLIGAGIDQPSPEDIGGTSCELVQQAFSGIALAIGHKIRREVVCTEGKFDTTSPTAVPVALSLECGGQTFVPFLIAFDPTLLETIEEKVNTAAPEAISRTPPAHPETRNSIELLLDVELPVGVSFGKAILPLRDVIKLTTGSIVELNRSVSEPVQVIVNNCVIAKGEVVVVDGNYGVRIHHIVSRQERLRSIR